MLEVRSPLARLLQINSNGVALSEAPGFTLTQAVGDDKAIKKALGKIPVAMGKAVECDGRTVMRTGNKQFWVLGDAPQPRPGLYITPLSSGRTRLLLEGDRARDVLSTCALIDFHPTQFKAGQFVLTGIHHTPVLIHCLSSDSFHIYALRTFALNVWEWLADMMEGLPRD